MIMRAMAWANNGEPDAKPTDPSLSREVGGFRDCIAAIFTPPCFQS